MLQIFLKCFKHFIKILMKHVTLSVSVPLVMPPRLLKQDVLFKIDSCMLNNLFLTFMLYWNFSFKVLEKCQDFVDNENRLNHFVYIKGPSSRKFRQGCVRSLDKMFRHHPLGMQNR